MYEDFMRLAKILRRPDEDNEVFLLFPAGDHEGEGKKKGQEGPERQKGWSLDNFMPTNVLCMQVPLQCHDKTTGYICHCTSARTLSSESPTKST